MTKCIRQQFVIKRHGDTLKNVLLGVVERRSALASSGRSVDLSGLFRGFVQGLGSLLGQRIGLARMHFLS